MCDQTGFDNDGNGLAGCDDPACHDFADHDAFCTRLLCGDPQSDYEVREFSYRGAWAVGSDSFARESAFVAEQPTLFRGQLVFNENDNGQLYDFPSDNATGAATSLRCVLPYYDPVDGQQIAGSGTLSVNNKGLRSREALGHLTVLGEDLIMEHQDDRNMQGFEAFTSLKHIGGTLRVVEADYFNSIPPPEALDFVGLDNLLTLGGDLEVRYPNDSRWDWRQIVLEGLSGLRYVGGTLIKVVIVNGESQGCAVVPTDEDEVSAPRAYPQGFIQDCDLEPGQMRLTDVVFSRGEAVAISSFAPLSRLRRVDGHLCFDLDAAFTDFSGLEQLERVGGSIGLRFDPNAGDVGGARFKGLETLQCVVGDFELLERDGGSPTKEYTFEGLEQLERVGGRLANVRRGDFTFDEHARPSGMSGLNSLKSVGGLKLNLGVTFDDFQGLEALEIIQGDLILAHKASPEGDELLIAMSGLSALAEISGSVLMFEQLDLVNFAGLSALERVEGDLWVRRYHSSQFSSFQGFQGLSSLQVVGGTFGYSNETSSAPSTLPIPFAGLGALEQVGQLKLVETTTTSLQGLESLQRAGTVWLESLNQLTSLDGLSGLEEIDSALWPEGLFIPNGSTTPPGLHLFVLQNLTTLDGLNALTLLDGNLTLFEVGLMSVQELLDLTGFGGESVFIEQTGLSCAQMTALVTRLISVSTRLDPIDVAVSGPNQTSCWP